MISVIKVSDADADKESSELGSARPFEEQDSIIEVGKEAMDENLTLSMA